MKTNGSGLFFGVGSGRCGTMALANALNSEKSVLALHEGKVRKGEESGDQELPFLTLQNFQAYCDPGSALPLFVKTRGDMEAIADRLEKRFVGDIAYNYAPFVSAIRELYPESKLIFIYRNGRDFVRSAYTKESPDPTPVGWLDSDRKLDGVERYIALGRLRPSEKDPLAASWPSLSPIAKNAWLWSETNRIAMKSIRDWPKQSVYWLKYEDFFSDPIIGYESLRQFLGFDWSVSSETLAVFDRKINARKNSAQLGWD